MIKKNIPDDPTDYVYVYYTLSPLGENVQWNYDEANFPNGWNTTGYGLNDYIYDDIIYHSKEQYSIPASKKEEMLDRLVVFFKKQLEDGLLERFSVNRKQ